MSTATRPSLRHGSGIDHDDGLDHPHDWARERGMSHARGPMVADYAAVPMPSSAVHDDAHYAGF